METKLQFQQNKNMFKDLCGHMIIIRPKHDRHRPRIVAALSSSSSNNYKIATYCKSGIPKKTVYNDNQFDRIAIHYLSQSVQLTTGMRNRKSGYDSLVEAARAVSLNFNPVQQHQLVIQALEKAFPKQLLYLIRMILPQSKFTRELFAAFTTVFFVWLVGPCEAKESEVNGKKEKNVVHIKKCRFLEETNCIGMCTNLCKMPSQTFIKNSLGLPVNMVPNFDDMSCEMIFGEEPPAVADDPAFKQPCFKLCNN
ncbi:hypothetical protein Ddye_010120 [Dipteronia dyeriana]|uniref:Beta-carotene isomerase D27-like C-terminal domain-containing protein n=1 Tax=Dipteronia dyeriana TaxID=168575 RepID=A0AAD9XDN3_9ROSI|nr:hypothetical protein Ddye_010120 [Dipteronia dyeriana]